LSVSGRPRDADLVDEVAPVVGGVRHRVQAKRRGLRGLDVEVAGQAQGAAGADRGRDLADVGEQRRLAHLVDDAPVEPRPNSIDVEPRSTSIRSQLKTSRSQKAVSRTPSTKMSSLAVREKPRRMFSSPPSAAWKLMPAV
jgi:hypothetical protein